MANYPWTPVNGNTVNASDLKADLDYFDAKPSQPRAGWLSKSDMKVTNGATVSTTSSAMTTLGALDFGVVNYARMLTVTFDWGLTAASGSGSNGVIVSIGVGNSGLAVPTTWSTGGSEGFTTRQQNSAFIAAGQSVSGTITMSYWVGANSATNAMFVLGAYRATGSQTISANDLAGFATHGWQIEVSPTHTYQNMSIY